MEVFLAPASYAQRRLWLIDRLEPGNVAYHVPGGVRLRGELDPAVIAPVLAEIVRRHEALRTTFASQDGETVQLIHEELPVPLAHEAVEDEAALEEAIHREVHRPFDLVRGPLIRAALFSLGPRDHVFLVVFHHIVADGWSIGVLVREFGALYAAFAAGGPSPLPELPLQYADYAEWQKEWLESGVLETQLAYWKEQLGGVLPVLELPLDRRRPAVATHRGATAVFDLDGELTESLERLAQKSGASLFMVLLATFNALLARYTRQDDLLVGTPIANRGRVELEGLIGFFVNTLVLRSDLAGKPRFHELLARVQATCLDAYAHQDVPFELLVEALDPPRDRSRAPLFQVMFVLQNAPGELPRASESAIEVLEVATDGAKFDLTVMLERTPQGLRGRWEHNTDLFERATIERLAGHFQAVLCAVAGDPDRRAGEVDLLSDAERRQILEDWNRLESPDASTPLIEAFLTRAARHPERPALVMEDTFLSYGELARRVESQAARLAARGVGAEALVGLGVTRSFELVIGILTIQRAGAAYLPLDPAYPDERLAMMIEDSGVDALLIAAELGERYVSCSPSPAMERGLGGEDKPGSTKMLAPEALAASAQVVPLGDEAEDGDTAPLPPLPRPENAAYVIYTSGSTGRPKGVVVSHRNAARLMSATEPWYGFDQDDTWTLFHSYAFDFSVWELWGALLYGGRLVVVPYETSRSPAAFHHLLADERVTVLSQTPSAFAQLATVDAEHRVPLALRYVIFGGEALELAILEDWLARHGDEHPRMVNMYGITETTVHVTWRPLTEADVEARRGSIIGRQIPDLQLYIVDDRLALQPIGVPGEIRVGGAGLARGYLARPSLTAERFTPDPFASGRLYRTGDLGRWLADGEVEYLGRADHQVKVRGFRIEPGEIEAVLRREPDVEQAVVIARPGPEGTRRLVAYVVGSASVDALRRACRARLPDYMVPAAVVLLDELPLTAHGKLDRRALPEPELDEAVSRRAYEAPRDAVEERLATIWADVLGLSQVGIHDNFFALGGDSILGLQIVARAARQGLRLAPGMIFDHQTIAELAPNVERTDDAAVHGAPSSGAVEIPSALRGRDGLLDVYPLSPMQQGMLFESLYAERPGIYFEQITGRIDGELDLDAFTRAWQKVVERHDSLRTSYVWLEVESPLQAVWRSVEVPFAVLDWRDHEPAVQERLFAGYLERDRAQGFVLDRLPLMRMTIIRVAADGWRWLWSYHHLLLDGWCLPLVFGEALALYDALRRGEEPLLDEPLPFRAYIDWLAAQNQDAAGAFWQELLSGFEPTPLDLPAPRGAVDEAVDSVELYFPVDESTALDAWARARRLTVSTLSQGAWAVLLARLTGAWDVVFGVTVSGRPAELPGVESMIGLFINTLPARARVSDVLETETWLQELQTQAQAARRFEYSRLVDIQAAGDLAGQALFDSILVFENYPGGDALATLAESFRIHDVEVLERTNYPLTAAVIPGEMAGGRMMLKLSYDPHRFDKPTMERLLGHWRRLFTGIAGDVPRLGALSILSSAEERQLMAWSTAPADFGAPRPVHEVVAELARRTPDAPAVFAGEASLTYSELVRRAEDLARLLRRRGVKKEVTVGLCLQPSMAVAWGILGVFTAGGAYVPLDPRSPVERMAYQLADSGADLLLSDGAAALPEGVEVIAIDETGPSEVSGEPELPNVELGQLAYVIYTSGSTGRPKGVMVEHRGIFNLARAQSRAFGLGPADRVLQFASLTFDAAVSEIFIALTSGAALGFDPDHAIGSAAAFADLLQGQEISNVTLTPSLLAALDPADFPALSSLIVAGEAGTEELYTSWAVGRRLFNAYGPTEGTVCATIEEVSGQDPAGWRLNIGRPMAGARVHLFDRGGRPVPIGVAGQICLGGVGLARGYVQAPGRTAERFFPDALGDAAGGRLYATGDLGRWREDGRIEFLGRADQQVKIRGFRVEPGEIEAVLAEHPTVGGAVVLVREERGTKRLVAYTVPADAADEAIDASELRRHLATHLPEHMIPAVFIPLDAWPLTVSGKLDRRALPAPEDTEAASQRDFVAPTSELEATLATIWAAVLGLERVGVRDNFFALGGDSILSLQIIARAHREGLEMTPRELFQAATIEKLAPLVRRRAVVETVADVAEGEAPLTPIQHWFFAPDPPAPWHFNQSLLLALPEPLKPSPLRAALAAVLDHHDALRLRYHRDGDRWRQMYGEHGTLPLVVIDLGALTSDDQGCALEQVAGRLQASFDLAAGPLLRAAYFARGAREHRLFLAVHHLVIDGVSWRVLLEDLMTAYAQSRGGGAIALPPKTSSFKRWGEALRELAQSPELDSQLAFWRRQHGPALPLDHAADRRANRADDAASVSLSLTREETTSLLREAPAAYNTQINDLLLAALLRTVTGWTGGRALVVSLESHGRREVAPGVDVTRTVGWFTAIFPVRLELPDGDHPGELLKAVKEQLRAVPDGGLGHGLLRYLGADEAVRGELAALRRPELSFNYFGQLDPGGERGTTAPRMVAEPTGAEESPDALRRHLIDVSGRVSDGRLTISWIYARKLHRRSTVEALAASYVDHLRGLIAHCLSPDAGGFTPSDFDRVELDQDELDAILEDLES